MCSSNTTTFQSLQSLPETLDLWKPIAAVAPFTSVAMARIRTFMSQQKAKKASASLKAPAFVAASREEIDKATKIPGGVVKDLDGALGEER